MTTATVDTARVPISDGRFRVVRRLVAVELSVTVAEVILVQGPALALAAQSL